MTKKQKANIVRMFQSGISDILCIAYIIELMDGKGSALIAEQISEFMEEVYDMRVKEF